MYIGNLLSLRQVEDFKRREVFKQTRSAALAEWRQLGGGDYCKLGFFGN